MTKNLTLLEAVSIRAYLMESARPKFLKDNYGPKIEARYEEIKDSTPAAIVAEIDTMAGKDIAEKVISYLIAHDPTRNHQYSQWLLMRWLKGQLLFEDCPRVMGYLEVFDRAKSRIENRDINAYKSPADLYVALKPFIEDNAPVSSNAERTAEARRMHQDDQSKTILDTPTMKVVIPLTQEASNFFGRNTQWCTTSSVGSYFDSYSQRGPLYIILEKATNKRWQFHFASGQFMDENDRRVDLRSFLDAHPEIFKIVPESTWMPYASQIGLKWFSPEAVETIGAEKLIQQVDSLSDFLSLPEKMQKNESVISAIAKKIGIKVTEEELKDVPAAMRNDTDFQDGIARNLGLHVLTPREIMNVDPTRLKYMIDSVKDAKAIPKIFLENADIVQQICSYDKNIFSFMIPVLTRDIMKEILRHMPLWAISLYPPELIDDNEKIERAQAAGNANQIEMLPKPWPDEVTQRWFQYSATDLSKVPEKFRNALVIANCMRSSAIAPGGYQDAKGVEPFFKKWKSIITPEITAHEIMYLPVDAIPVEFLDNKLCAYALYRKLEVKYKSTYSRISSVELSALTKISSEFWTDEVYKKFLSINRYNDKKPSFDIIPEKFRNDEGVIEFIENKGDVSTIPVEYLTPDVMMSKGIDAQVIRTVDPSVLNDENIVNAIKKGYNYSGEQFELSTIPKGKLTPAVVRALVDKGRIPIQKIPKVLRTPDAITTRIAATSNDYDAKKNTYQEELRSLPEDEYTDAMCVALVKNSIRRDLLEYAPDSAMTTPVLNAILRIADNAEDEDAYSYHSHSSRHGIKYHTMLEKMISRFPQDTWTSGIVVAMMRQGFLPREVSAVPPSLMTGIVATEIALNKDELHKIPQHLIGDDTHSSAIATDLSHIERMDPESVTEPVMFKALSKLGSYDDMKTNHDPYRKKEYEILRKLPREKWTERCWMAAVSRILILKDVPAKFRTPKLIATAIERYPDTLRTMKDPAAWVAEHLPSFEKNLTDKSTKIAFHRMLEKEGVLAIAKAPKYINASSLDKKPLSGGFSFAEVFHNKGPRVYVFDKKGRFATALNRTEDNKIDYDRTAKPIRDQIIEVLNYQGKPLGDLQTGKYGIVDDCLKGIGIYFENGKAMTQDKLSRKKRTGGIEISTSGGITYWFKGKPIADIREEGSRYRYDGQYSKKLTHFVATNFPAVFKNRIAISTILSEDYKEHSVTKEMRNVGIIVSSAGFKPMEDVVVETPTIIALRTKTRLFLFIKEKGMMASAKITSSSDLTDIEIPYQSQMWEADYDEDKEASRKAKSEEILAKIETIMKEKSGKK